MKSKKNLSAGRKIDILNKRCKLCLVKVTTLSRTIAETLWIRSAETSDAIPYNMQGEMGIS